MDLLTWLIIIIIVIVLSGIKVITEYQRAVVFRLGRLVGARGPGLIFVMPIFERSVRVGLRTVTMMIPSQKIITKDNVSIDIAAVAYYHIVDAEKSVVAIENVRDAVNQISQTTVRNVVGQFMLDQFLSQTIDINEKIKDVIDGHTEPWGIQVTAVEIKDVTLPDNMQRAMAKEAEAERERRAKIVAAQGEFQAAEMLGQAADIIAELIRLHSSSHVANHVRDRNRKEFNDHIPGAVHDHGQGSTRNDPAGYEAEIKDYFTSFNFFARGHFLISASRFNAILRFFCGSEYIMRFAPCVRV